MCIMPLLETQSKFVEALLGSQKILDLFSSLKSDERFAIYRNNVIGSLTEALLAAYPLTAQLTGDEYARKMLRDFIQRHPPSEGNISAYGAAFPEFLRAYPHGLEYLPDVARFEWAAHEAAHAADDAALEPQEFSEALCLRASVKVMESKWPLPEIRDFCANPEGVLDVGRPGGFWLVYRPHLEVKILPLSAEEYALLERMAEGRALADALDETLKAFPAFDFRSFLAKFAGLRIFTSRPGAPA
jgi:hypothetical protein